MKHLVIFATALLMALPALGEELETESPQPKGPKKENTAEKEHPGHLKFYGFIRNYFNYDSREGVKGTADLFYYVPKDESLNEYGDDLNSQSSFRFLALTSRIGLDVTGYQFGRTKFGAKIETDFYSGLSGSTGTAALRLRQAYVTIGWDDLNEGKNSVFLKIGQAWHPIAADQPDVISLETGAPFNAFSRTPMLLMDANLGKHFTISGAAIWQMQYTSMGISAYSEDSWTWSKSADYIKYGCTPEFYAGLSYKSGGFLTRVGLSVLSIKPRNTGTDSNGVEVKVSDRITTVNPYFYLQYKGKKWGVKAKTIYSQSGDHFNMMSGYGISDASADDGHYEYTPLQVSSTWASFSYGTKWQFTCMVGYLKNLGTVDKLVTNADGTANSSAFCFSSNGYKNLNSLWRVEPCIAYNAGKFTIALEYNVTSAQYGDSSTYTAYGLAKNDLHWVTNHRIQTMVKFSF